MAKGIGREPEPSQTENVRFTIREMVEAGDFVDLGVKPGHIGPYPSEIVDLYTALTDGQVFTDQEIGVSGINI